MEECYEGLRTGRSFPEPDASGVNLGGWGKPGLSGLTAELWSLQRQKNESLESVKIKIALEMQGSTSEEN